MFNTEYLYLRPLELGLLYGAFLMIPLIILIVLTAMGKVRGKPLRIIVVAFLSAVASISAMVAVDIHAAKNYETVTTEAVYLSSDDPLIPLIPYIDYETYNFYRLNNGEVFCPDIHDKRRELVEGLVRFEEGHIYEVTYAGEPVWEILAVEDTGRSVHDKDSSTETYVMGKKADEETTFDQYDIFYYGKESKLMKAWVEELRYPKANGWTKDDIWTPEENYPGIEELDFVTTQFLETDDDYVVVITMTGLDQLEHMQRLEEVEYFTLGAEDSSVCNVNGWINVMKEDGFKHLSQQYVKELELHYWDGKKPDEKKKYIKKRFETKTIAPTAENDSSFV